MTSRDRNTSTQHTVDQHLNMRPTMDNADVYLSATPCE